MDPDHEVPKPISLRSTIESTALADRQHLSDPSHMGGLHYSPVGALAERRLILRALRRKTAIEVDWRPARRPLPANAHAAPGPYPIARPPRVSRAVRVGLPPLEP